MSDYRLIKGKLLYDIKGFDPEEGKVVKEDEFFFPVTHEKFVIDDSGNNIGSKFDGYAEHIEERMNSQDARIEEISQGQIADDAVSTPKIQDGAVTLVKLNQEVVDYIDGSALGDDDVIVKDSNNVFHLKDSGVQDYHLSETLKDKIDNAGKSDEVTIHKDPTTNEMSVKDGGISTAKLAADVKQKIEDAGKADATTLVKNADGTISIKDGGVAKAKLGTDVFDDLDVTDTAVDGKYVSKVEETDGKISVTRELFPVDDESIELDSDSKLSVKEDGITDVEIADDAILTDHIKDANVTFAKVDEDIQGVILRLASFIDVEQDGFYVVDGDLNIGFKCDTAGCNGIGLVTK